MKWVGVTDDYANDTVAKDARRDPRTERSNGEKRAVAFENKVRVAFGDKNIRKTYGGAPAIPAGTTYKDYHKEKTYNEYKKIRGVGGSY